MVIRQRLRPFELDPARRLDRAAGHAPPLTARFSCLPIGDVEIEDNWFVCGLSGTGSKNIIVSEVFVPEHRVLLFADTRSGRTPGGQHHQNPLYRLPLLVLGAHDAGLDRSRRGQRGPRGLSGDDRPGARPAAPWPAAGSR